MTALRSDSPVQFVKGVGPHRAAAFAALGVHTVGDLLEYFPHRYESDAGEIRIAELRPGTRATVRGEITRVAWRLPGLRAQLDDGSGACMLRWFHQPRGGVKLFRGAHVLATGQVGEYDARLELIQPQVQLITPGANVGPMPPGTRQLGVYAASAALKSCTIRRAVDEVLAQPELPVTDVLPPALLAKRRLPTRATAIRALHQPADEAQLDEARRRLAYEELFLIELAMGLRRQRRVALRPGRKLHVTPEIDRRIRARFPFALTAAQNHVVREIARDLQGGHAMTRLLQGDVGSGKTVVALYACLVAVAHQRQAAIMAPTEILAQQHYRNIDRYLHDSRVRHVLLSGSLTRKQRTDILDAIAAGRLDLVVGTQALIQQDVAFRDLALVVVDEQHKFGVLQRHEFRTKGPRPHYLVMTATPIPRTLAMTVCGDLDVSVIRHSPPGRGGIETRVVRAGQWRTVMRYVRTRLERGEQAYVVCPLIEEKDDPDPQRPAAPTRSAVQTHAELQSGPWSGLAIGLLHGALAPAEKAATVADFTAGRLHALVATTVVEVGVDVPNATLMIVEHADRFGLSQLHQLRGRVGRGPRDSLCVLIARGRSAQAAERLGILAETTDGFRIAEADLRLRGPGDLFGTRQHGLPALRVADLTRDFALLEQARDDAFALVAEDPQLSRPQHQALLPALRRVFGDQLRLIDAG